MNMILNRHYRAFFSGLFWFALLIASAIATHSQQVQAQATQRGVQTVAELIALKPSVLGTGLDANGQYRGYVTVAYGSQAGVYSLTNTWVSTNTSTRLASLTSNYSWDLIALVSQAGASVAQLNSLSNTLTTAIVPYPYSYSGSNITVGPSIITWADGQISTVPQATVFLLPSFTNYIGVDLFTQAIVNYARGTDMGTKFVLQVVTGTNASPTAITVLANDTFAPSTYLQGAKDKILGGNLNVTVEAIGDSISGPYVGGYVTNWFQALFTQSTWATNAYIAHNGTWSAYNYAVGTQTPLMGLTTIGSSVPGLNFNGTSGNLGIVQALYPETATLGTYNSSPAIDGGIDLAIVGYYNDVTYLNSQYKMAYLEAIVRRLRLRGIPVIVHCTEPQLGTSGTNYWDHWTDGIKCRQIADQHGAMFLDTQSRAIWYVLNYGNSSFYVDSVNLHPNDNGQLQWATWMRAILCPGRQRSIDRSGQWHMSQSPTNTYGSFAFPFSHDYQQTYQLSGSPVPTYTNNAYTGVGLSSFNSANPAVYVGKLPSSSAVYMTNGGICNFSHPCALTFNLLIDGVLAASPFTFDIKIGSTTIKSITVSGSLGARPAVIECLTVEDMRAISSSVYNYGKADFFDAIAIGVNCTGGAANILGGIWGVPAYRDIPLNELDFQGTWSRSSLDTGNSNGILIGTDTSGDNVRMTFRGAGAQLLLQGGTKAGFYSVRLDGVLQTVISGTTKSNGAFDGYIGANRYIPINLFPNATPSTNAMAWGNIPHTVLVTYLGTNNASAVSATATGRRLGVAGARVFNSTDIR